LKSSRVFVHAQPIREFGGIVVGEALVSGVPVVGYKLSCYPGAFGDFIRYVEPFDLDAFRRTVEDEVRRQRAGDNYLVKMDWREMKQRLSWETSQRNFPGGFGKSTKQNVYGTGPEYEEFTEKSFVPDVVINLSQSLSDTTDRGVVTNRPGSCNYNVACWLTICLKDNAPNRKISR